MQTSTLLQYKNQNYQLNIEYDNELIKLCLKSQDEVFYNEFDQEFIEQLTRKTGNYKKMEIFTEMLFKCCQMNDKILSFSIREFGQSNEKLYLVLTYAVAYDRVHYPLPLIVKHCESIDFTSSNYKQARLNESINSNKSTTSLRKPLERIENSRVLSESVNIHQLLKNVNAIKKCVAKRDYDSAYKELDELERILRLHLNPNSKARERSQQRYYSPSRPISSNYSPSRPKSTNYSPSRPSKSREYSLEPKKYKVIKSEPLIERRKSFKRFDPTEYYY